MILRIIVNLFSRWVKTDRLCDQFPISIKSVIKDENRYLLLKNERDEWDFPGGKLENGFSAEQTLKREVLEESNLDIEIKNLVYFNQHMVNNINVAIVIYDTSIISNNPILISFEHLEYGFFTKNEILNNDINCPIWVRKLIQENL